MLRIKLEKMRVDLAIQLAAPSAAGHTLTTDLLDEWKSAGIFGFSTHGGTGGNGNAPRVQNYIPMTQRYGIE